MSKRMQDAISDWNKETGWPYWQPHEILARLMEETGELARAINIGYGQKKKKANDAEVNIEEEMGDILFTLACLSNSLGFDMDRAFDLAYQKATGRDKTLYVETPEKK